MKTNKYIHLFWMVLVIGLAGCMPDKQHGNLLLYWKCSDHMEHYELEPFLMLLGRDTVDPMQLELLEFMN